MSKDLFEDYVPEVIEYNADTDGKLPINKKTESNLNEEIVKTEHKTKTSAKDLFKDYVPEVVEYNEVIDGSDEYKIRDNHLETKQDLIGKIRKAKAAAKGNQTTFRGNIRTENEK